jgi:hypothetical protein
MVFGKTRKPPHRLIVAIRRYGNEVTAGTDINASGIRMGQFELDTLAGSHGFAP